MAVNTFDTEIRKYLPLLGNEEKKSILDIIKKILHIETVARQDNNINKRGTHIDYTKYRFPVSDIKFNRDEINER
ncbi:MAG: hypothetical protein K0Q79_2215 [Flavipsychrobacter sp.]|jgi:hypothetical protein|nr:hypothetical protein [Flavipsychrobacter sp.]